jgi:hypothetical protein
MPGQANPNQTINYTSSSGIKVWNEAIAPLTFEFNIEANEVNAFCENLMEQVEKSGWKVTGANIIDVPETDDPGTPTCNVITEYGQLSVERICMHTAQPTSIKIHVRHRTTFRCITASHPHLPRKAESRF